MAEESAQPKKTTSWHEEHRHYHLRCVPNPGTAKLERSAKCLQENKLIDSASTQGNGIEIIFSGHRDKYAAVARVKRILADVLPVATYKYQLSSTDAANLDKSGNDSLSDSKLRQKVQELLGDKVGNVVVIDSIASPVACVPFLVASSSSKRCATLQIVSGNPIAQALERQLACAQASNSSSTVLPYQGFFVITLPERTIDDIIWLLYNSVKDGNKLPSGPDAHCHLHNLIGHTLGLERIAVASDLGEVAPDIGEAMRRDEEDVVSGSILPPMLIVPPLETPGFKRDSMANKIRQDTNLGTAI